MNQLSHPFENILITTVTDGSFFVNDLFQRRFAHAAPNFGSAVICFYREANHHFIPFCYANFCKHDEVMLVGGAMTDGEVFGYMTGDLAEKIQISGGIYYCSGIVNLAT